MLSKLFDLEDYAGTYRETRNAYLKAANQLKLVTPVRCDARACRLDAGASLCCWMPARSLAVCSCVLRAHPS